MSEDSNDIAAEFCRMEAGQDEAIERAVAEERERWREPFSILLDIAKRANPGLDLSEYVKIRETP